MLTDDTKWCYLTLIPIKFVSPPSFLMSPLSWHLKHVMWELKQRQTETHFSGTLNKPMLEDIIVGDIRNDHCVIFTNCGLIISNTVSVPTTEMAQPGSPCGCVTARTHRRPKVSQSNRVQANLKAGSDKRAGSQLWRRGLQDYLTIWHKTVGQIMFAIPFYLTCENMQR